MKKGLVIIGVILLVVGLLMMLFMWPMIGTIDSEELAKKIADEESGTFTVMDEVTQDEWDEGGELEQAVAKEMGIDGPGTYVATYELDNGVPKDLIPSYTKVPTMGGILGLILLIVGVILLIVGAATGRAAPMAPAQPPMGQPPMEQQPYQPPPGQQPYQPPPGQQPYQPPPGQQPYQPPQ